MSSADHWNSLASSLGADAPDEPPEQAQIPAAKSPHPARTPVPRPKKPPPPRPSADWSKLAGELGAAPAEPAAPIEPARAPAHAEPAKRSAPPAPESAEAPPWSTPMASELSDEPRNVVEAAVVSEYGAEDFLDEEVIEAELVEHHGEAAAPTPRADEDGTRKRRRRRRGGRRVRKDRETADVGPPGEETAGQSGAVEEDLFDIDPLAGIESAESAEATEAGEAESAEPRERKGRRRRRRRGSARGREAKRAEAADDDGKGEPSEEAAEAGTDEESDTRTLPSDDDEVEGAEPQADKNSHRAIPAWEEAIGYIISANMEARAKNPKSGGEPRGRGRGRGGRGNSRGDGHRRG